MANNSPVEVQSLVLRDFSSRMVPSKPRESLSSFSRSDKGIGDTEVFMGGALCCDSQFLLFVRRYVSLRLQTPHTPGSALGLIVDPLVDLCFTHPGFGKGLNQPAQVKVCNGVSHARNLLHLRSWLSFSGVKPQGMNM